ncbi:MAG: cation acetate symporter [Verrucomicrobia bacterium]|nr:cation acetate symporter [Verrucomicrobiota bacterium]
MGSLLFAEVELTAVTLFAAFVVFVLWLSFYLGRRTKSSKSYFAAGGGIHWSVNGIAFAGDYLSAASFLGICGMIATVGYDGFLYSIGYLAGWIVALFVVAEPMKRLGKYTFTDALDSKFNSRGIQLAAAISTLVVSICYLIPQMVGAGALVYPLLGLPKSMGVIMVGAIVITIVATAGMTSTTYVQFIKGGLLVIFSLILVISVCVRGLSTSPDRNGEAPLYSYATMTATENGEGELILDNESYQYLAVKQIKDLRLIKLMKDNAEGVAQVGWWKNQVNDDGTITLSECQSKTTAPDGATVLNGEEASPDSDFRPAGHLIAIEGKSGDEAKTDSIGPFEFLAKLSSPETIIRQEREVSFEDGKDKVVVRYPISFTGDQVMNPGLQFKVGGTIWERLNFVSLMLALFCGTAALPHILIRYYTVPSQACARKSTIVAIAVIGFFYILTLYMGLGAMVNNVVDVGDNNMAGPLLAKSFGVFLFSIISAIAFATILGTVSGLIVAASGAVAHDFLDRFIKLDFTDRQKVYAGKVAAFSVGLVAIILGIVFEGMNVSYLVGWAFAVAASANLPAIIMLLFWKKTTAKGIVASIIVGVVAALGIILLSPEMYTKLYKLDPALAPMPFDSPAVISVPLSFAALVVVSLLTQKNGRSAKVAAA